MLVLASVDGAVAGGAMLFVVDWARGLATGDPGGALGAAVLGAANRPLALEGSGAETGAVGRPGGGLAGAATCDEVNAMGVS
jgi:hypothetical protein